MEKLRVLLRSFAGRLSVVVAVSLVFAGGTKLAYETIHQSINQKYLTGLSAQLLERAELSADYAIITLADLTSKNLGACQPETLFELRDALFSRGSVKDIVVLGREGQVLCSGLPRSLGMNLLDLSLENPFVGSNDAIRFYDISRGDDGLMGIAWHFGFFTAVAILNVDSLLFDALPSELRDLSTARIGFTGHHAIAIRDGLPKEIGGTSLAFSHASPRYPLEVGLLVSPQALSVYNRQYEWQSILGGGIVGIAFGALIAQILARPTDPKTLMRAALNANQFKPFIQPLFSLPDRRIIGGEALMRWVLHDGTIVPPSRFIPLAEDSGLIVPMTRAIISEALDNLREILATDRDFKVSFNITPAHLCCPGFIEDLQELVSDSPAEPTQIVLELTERQEHDNADAAARIVRRLRKLGFRTALDDTGTGHNGLSYVQDLGADIIKIDKKFVDSISGQGGGEVVEILVRLAKSLNMTTIAEGIETEEQAVALTNLGVDQGQGYLVSRPLHPAAFCALINEKPVSNSPTLDADADAA